MFRLTNGQKIFTRTYISILIIIILVPLLYIFFMAFKRPAEVFQSYFFIFPKHFTVQNFPNAVELAKKTMGVTYPKMFLNSIIVTSGGLLCAILAASFSAFAMVYYKFRIKEIYYTFILLCYMIPLQVLLIPLYILLYRFQLINTYWALIFPYGTIGIPLATIILRNFFAQIPIELRDSAHIDGANALQIYKNIYMPLAKPALAAVIIFLFLEMWNEFLLAYIFLREESLSTLPLAMSRLGIGSKFPIPWGVYAASILIVIIPILIVFLILQRWFVRGSFMGSIKG